ncbi:putative metal-binding motif-containing protein [bacterium]|nr:putative metal-binding motif-containing protein [bacterium]
MNSITSQSDYSLFRINIFKTYCIIFLSIFFNYYNVFAFVGDTHTIITNNVYPSILPDISYNPLTEKYLVVWEGGYRNGDYYIYGRIINKDGSPASSRITLGVGIYNIKNPKVACANSNYWVVVYSRDMLFGYDAIDAITVDENGNLSDIASISEGLYNRDFPDIGGSVVNDQYLIVWEQRNLINLYEIKGRRYAVGSGGQSQGSELTIANSVLNERLKPAVNQRGINFLVSWEKHIDSNRIDIEGRFVPYYVSNDNDLGNVIDIENDSGINRNPSVASNLDLNHFLIVYDHEYSSNDYDIHFAFTSPTELLNTNLLAFSSDLETRPAAIFTGIADKFAVTYARASDWSGNWDIYSIGLESSGSTHNEEIIASDTINEGNPEGSSVGESNGKIVITWDRENSGNLYSRDLYIYEPNNAPELTNGGVTPISGNASTTFSYTVDYFDADKDSPVTKNVYIDGTAHSMSLINGTYRYQTTLSAGSHNYYFDFKDGNGGSDRLPPSGSFSGPSVSVPNHAPELSSGGVSPGSGNASTTFSYTVDYYDADGDSPVTKNVYIDGTAHSMSLINGTYRYQTTLSAGSHNYYFDFKDGNGGSDRLPPSGSFSGPNVDNVPSTPVIYMPWIPLLLLADKSSQTCIDSDEDNYYAQSGCGTAVDCNDGNNSVYPGATELCDGIDNQCPGDQGYGLEDEGCGPVGAGDINEIEPNNTLAIAQNIDDHFVLGNNEDVGDSTTIPWVSIKGTGDGTFDYYKFYSPGSTIGTKFDIDYGYQPGDSGSFDSFTAIWDSSGICLYCDHGGSSSAGAGGSTHNEDSYNGYIITEPGWYIIGVSQDGSGIVCPNDKSDLNGGFAGPLSPVPSGATYELQVSIPGHSVDYDTNFCGTWSETDGDHGTFCMSLNISETTFNGKYDVTKLTHEGGSGTYTISGTRAGNIYQGDDSRGRQFTLELSNDYSFISGSYYDPDGGETGTLISP